MRGRFFLWLVSMKTIRVRGWERWQSYRRDRGQPPWIKVHRCVMRNPEWVQLTDAQRGQLVAMWLLAADQDGAIPASPRIIQKLCFMDSEPDLQLFVSLGFLEADANVTPTWRQSDSPETETETEAEAEEEEEVEAVGFATLPLIQQKAIAGLYGLNGGSGTQEHIWKGVTDDRAERMRYVDTAVLRMQSEGKQYNAPFFRSILTRVIAEESAGVPDDIWSDD